MGAKRGASCVPHGPYRCSDESAPVGVVWTMGEQSARGGEMEGAVSTHVLQPPEGVVSGVPLSRSVSLNSSLNVPPTGPAQRREGPWCVGSEAGDVLGVFRDGAAEDVQQECLRGGDSGHCVVWSVGRRECIGERRYTCYHITTAKPTLDSDSWMRSWKAGGVDI